MKISLSWLKQFVDIDLPVDQIAKLLTVLGLEVDSVDDVGPDFSGVVVGEVKSTEKHPNADSLVVAQVSDGINEYQVVCGASNCRTGLKTAFAKLGAVLKDEGGKDFKIKKSALRGVESSGMLCSLKELNLGTADEGIAEFSEFAEVGKDLASLYIDTVFEVSLTPNLGHCLSVFGVARELAASLSLPLKSPFKVFNWPAGVPNYKVVITDAVKCPRYTCCEIKDVKIGPSPDWIQRKLIASGLRPVNNVVDITNYVLLEVGQPLHAFDKDKLSGNTLFVKTAQTGDNFPALDGNNYLLADGDITICDEKGPIALGGVMGGDNSKVTDTTHTIVLESAVFDPKTIRKTSRRLGLISDSSYRFEKGIDAENASLALLRAAELIVELCGGEVVGTLTEAYPGKKQPLIIDCRLEKVQKLLGVQLSSGEIETFLSRLGMKVRYDATKEVFSVTVPSWRNDVKEEVDIIEEVARMYGYDNIPRLQGSYRNSAFGDNPVYIFEGEIRHLLVGEGLQELLTCDLISPQQIAHAVDKSFPRDAIIEVLKPSSIDQSVLRPSMLPGMLQAVKHNLDHQIRSISGFELGRVHYKQNDLYIDQDAVGIILTGNSAPYNWLEKTEEVDFYSLKGMIENFLQGVGIAPYVTSPSKLTTLHPGRQAAVFVGENEVGAFGEIHPEVLRFYNIDQKVLFAEFNLHNLLQVRLPSKEYQALPVFPASERDWTITLNESQPVGPLLQAAQAAPSRLLKEVILLDIFRGGKLEASQKNVTLRFVYRDDKKTIAQQAVDIEHDRITQHVNKSLGR
ncbi:MAG: phenylalanine--tRNA ligase subunit beta [Parachlamydiales bacterium]|jgi:phenylalanyl-tRNA synthetase beta chain